MTILHSLIFNHNAYSQIKPIYDSVTGRCILPGRIDTIDGRVRHTLDGLKQPVLEYKHTDCGTIFMVHHIWHVVGCDYRDYYGNPYIEDAGMSDVLVYLKGSFKHIRDRAAWRCGEIEFASDTAALYVLQHWHEEFCDQVEVLLDGKKFVTMEEAEKLWGVLSVSAFNGYHHVSIHRDRRYIYLYASQSGVYTPPESVVVDLTEDSRRIKRFIKRGKYRLSDK